MADAPSIARSGQAEEVLLQARKHDLYTAIRTLTRDYEDGTVDDAVYQKARDRYEREAAQVLERLDALAVAPLSPPGMARRTRLDAWPAVLIATGLVAGAVVLFLVAAVHNRGAGTITGSQPITGPTAAPVATAAAAPLRTAQLQTRHHPTSVPAWLALGNAYLSAGNPREADRAFRTASRLAPGRPEARTLDALALAAEGRFTPALTLLSNVERSRPAYAKAWLTDGLIAARRSPGIPRAIRAWKRFLTLAPHSPVSAQVRASLRRLEDMDRSSR